MAGDRDQLGVLAVVRHVTWLLRFAGWSGE
jgi:hypothetical protein